jgi:WD40 repeat protein
VRVWDSETGQLVRTLVGHTDTVRSAVQLTDGRLATGSDDKTIRGWDLASGDCCFTYVGDARVTALILLPHNEMTFTSDKANVRVLE